MGLFKKKLPPYHFAESLTPSGSSEPFGAKERRATALTIGFDFYLDEETNNDRYKEWLRKEVRRTVLHLGFEWPIVFDSAGGPAARIRKAQFAIGNTLASPLATLPPLPAHSKYMKYDDTRRSRWHPDGNEDAFRFIVPEFKITSIEETYWYYSTEEKPQISALLEMTEADRSRHIYLAGKSQYGKSTLILNLALNDIKRGRGVCVLDPHGDLADALVALVPHDRLEDCVYLDATQPIPVDFMGWETDRERDILADDLLVTFKRFSEGWGERMESILRYTIYTLLAARHTTFLDIYHFLATADHGEWPLRRTYCPCRACILRRVQNQDPRNYWTDQFPPINRGGATNPITSRMAKFLLTPALKEILGNPEPKLNIFRLMESGKILLVNLARIGQESGNLLGTLLVSKIQQSAMRRQTQQPSDRVPFYLYADEFQRFQTSAFDVIMSEAGKYRLCLTLAHQYLDQLDPKIKSSIFGNVSTFCLFRLDLPDANRFKGQIHPDHIEAIPQLPRGFIVYRPLAGESQRLSTPPAPTPLHDNYAQFIKKRTVEKYACDTPPDTVGFKQDDANRDRSKPQEKPEPQPGKAPVQTHRSKKESP